MNLMKMFNNKSMKKLLVFIIVVLTFVSCYNRQKHVKDTNKTVVTEVPYAYTKQIILHSSCFTYEQISRIRHFNYNGHDYIQFHISSSHGGNGGVVHDPDCKCLK